jgi:hypothetical protein
VISAVVDELFMFAAVFLESTDGSPHVVHFSERRIAERSAFQK